MSHREPPIGPGLPPKRRNRRLAMIAAVVLLATGGTLTTVAAVRQESPPRPPSARGATPAPGSTTATWGAARGAAPYQTPTTKPTVKPTIKPTIEPTAKPSAQEGSAPPPATTGVVLPASVPMSLDIPAIGASSQLLRLGLNRDGTVEVPPVGEKDSHAGWYDKSPTPGQLGPAVILGHIDSAKYGPGVFFKLGALRPGNAVNVTRSDGTVAVFTIDKVAKYPKTDFPTLDVYGNINHAGLRLITCGGTFDAAAHSYRDNIVAYASLTASRRA